MRRREFVALVGGVATLSPLRTAAQRSDPPRRIGVLMAFAASDLSAQARVAAFRNGLRALGWTEGHNLHLEVRWGTSDAAALEQLAKEIVGLRPAVILSHNTPTTAALLHQGRRTARVMRSSSPMLGAVREVAIRLAPVKTIVKLIATINRRAGTDVTA